MISLCHHLSLAFAFIFSLWAFTCMSTLLDIKLKAKRITLHIVFAAANSLCLLATTLRHTKLTNLFFVIFVILFTEFILLFKTNVLALLTVTVTYVLQLACAHAIACGIISLATKQSIFSVFHSIKYRLALLVLSAVIFVFLTALHSFSWNIKNVKALLQIKNQLKLICFVVASMALYISICANAYYINLPIFWFTIFHIASASMTCVAHYVLVNSGIKFSIWINDFFNNALLNEQIRLQHVHYEIYEQNVQSYLAFKKHYTGFIEDIGNHIEHNEIGAALSLLQNVSENIQGLYSHSKTYSNNMLVDCVLWDTSQAAAALKADFQAKVYIPDKLKLSELELCRIFTNLCANALEASENVKNIENRFIHLTSAVFDNWLTITVLNTYFGKLNIQNGEIITSKDDFYLHGIGLKSIKEILNKHEGFCEIHDEEKSGIFKITIHLPI